LKRSRVIGVEEIKGCGGHGVAQLVCQFATISKVRLWDRYDDNKLKGKTEKKSRYVNNKHNVTYVEIKKNSPVSSNEFFILNSFISTLWLCHWQRYLKCF